LGEGGVAASAGEAPYMAVRRSKGIAKMIRAGSQPLAGVDKIRRGPSSDPVYVALLRSIHKSKIDEVLRNGLKAVSEYDNLGLEMRRGVVYCWLRKEDDKFTSGGRRLITYMSK